MTISLLLKECFNISKLVKDFLKIDFILLNIARQISYYIHTKFAFDFVKREKFMPELHLLIKLFWTNLVRNKTSTAPKKESYSMPNLNFFGAN